jgi:hypothetical protein
MQTPPSQRLIQHLRRLPPGGWLRRRTWLQLLRSERNTPPQIRLKSGGSRAELAGGALEIRAPAVERWRDMAAARVSEIDPGGLRRWTLPPWWHSQAGEARLASHSAQLRYGIWQLALPAAEVPVLVARLRSEKINGVTTTVWADGSPPYWEAGPAEAPATNHPLPEPPDEDDDEEQPQILVFTGVVAVVSSPFQVLPERYQILK